jgi:hypothetical protein
LWLAVPWIFRFLKCNKANERRVKRATWRLKNVIRLGRRLTVEDYVKGLVARVGLLAPVVKSAAELLSGTRHTWRRLERYTDQKAYRHSPQRQEST